MKSDTDDRGLGHVIARRRLAAERDGKTIYSNVQLGEPRKRRGAWECPFHISRTSKGVQIAYGEDAFQALIMALEGIRVTLDKDATAYSWLGGALANGGFRRFVPQGFGGDLQHKLESLIEREILRFAKAAERSRRKKRS
jgi:Domain of unknown function (DUF6968)